MLCSSVLCCTLPYHSRLLHSTPDHSILYYSTLCYSHRCLVAKSCPTLATPWPIAYQASQSMGFSRQEYWSGLPFPSPGDLLNPGTEPRSPALQADSLPTELQGKPNTLVLLIFLHIMKEKTLLHPLPFQNHGCGQGLQHSLASLA